MERTISFVPGEFYHLYNRGVDKRTIFGTPRDYKRFLALLYLANGEEDIRLSNILRTASYDSVFELERGEPLVAIGAYCLMPNHFHLLVTPLGDDCISRFMLKLQTGYSMYFNTKHERNGALFQGPFRGLHADNDRYLQYLFAYIHLNPAKLRDLKWKERGALAQSAWQFVEEYPYSSYRAYMNNAHTITNPSAFPDYFSNQEDVKGHIADWLEVAGADVERVERSRRL